MLLCEIRNQLPPTLEEFAALHKAGFSYIRDIRIERGLDKDTGYDILNKQYQQIVSNFSKFPKLIYRGIDLPNGINQLDTNHIGVHWSYTLNNAVAYSTTHSASTTPSSLIVIVARIESPQQINWLSTIAYNLLANETEVTLNGGTKVELVGYIKNGQQHPYRIDATT